MIFDETVWNRKTSSAIYPRWINATIFLLSVSFAISITSIRIVSRAPTSPAGAGSWKYASIFYIYSCIPASAIRSSIILYCTVP